MNFRNILIDEKYLIQFFLLIFIAVLNFQCSKPINSSKENNDLTVLPKAFVGEYYSVALESDSLESPDTWVLDEPKDLPEGLILDTIRGIIEGVPLYDGVYILKVYASKATEPNKWYQSFLGIEVSEEQALNQYKDLQIITHSPLPYANVNEYYEVQLFTRGSDHSVIWKSEMLPNSLTLDPYTGIIKGIPYDKGRFCINIYAFEQGHTTIKDQKLFALVVGDSQNNESGEIIDLSPQLTDLALAKLECGSIIFNPPTTMMVGKPKEVHLYISLNLSNSEIKEEILGRTNLKEPLETLAEKGIDVSKVEKSVEELENKIIKEEKNEIVIPEEEFKPIEEEVKELEKHGANKEETQKAIDELKQAVENVRNMVVVGRLLSANVRLTNQMKANLYGLNFDIEPISNEIQAVSSTGITEWTWNIKALKPNKQKLRLELSAIINEKGSTAPLTIQTFEKEIVVEVTPIIMVMNFYNSNWQWIWGTLLIPFLIWFGAILFKRLRNYNKKAD